MAKQTSMATMVANLELRSTQYKREMAQAAARNKQLTREIKSTSAAGDMFGRSMRGAAQGVAAIDGPLGGVAGRLSAVNGLVTGGGLAWAGLGVAIAGATAVMYKSIRAAEEMERGQLKIEALLRATGNASGRTAQELDEQARSVARNTLASVSGMRDAQGVLLTFKSVQTDVFDQAIVLSQDLAAVMGGDAKSAALQLGKALEDPASGLTALKRSGVSFTETEKEQIRTMQESGQVAEAQRFILAKLAQQVGGAGSGEAGGLAGQVDTLSQNWQEFLEAMGRTEEASKSVGFVADAVSWWRTVLMPTEAEKSADKYFELQDKYVAHQKLLEKATAQGVTVQIEQQSYWVEKYRAQLQEMKDADLTAAMARREEQKKAAEAAAAAREQAERDRAAEELKRQQDAGSLQLSQLDQFLADQSGKIQLDHEQRLQQIAALQISEQELRKRGFESTEALRAEYAEREKARYQMALAEEQARSESGEGDGNQAGADGLTDAERQRMVARLETLQLSWLTEMEQLQVQQDEEMALLDQGYASKLFAHDEYERRLTLLENKHRKQREKLEQASNKSKLKMFTAGAGQILSAAAAYNQKAAKAEMAVAVFSTGVSLVKNIAKASEIGYPQNIPMIAGAITQGVQIAGMLSSLKAPGGVSGDASAPSMSTGGAVAATPSESFASSGNDGFVEGETKQPASQYIFEFHGPVGDRADQFIEDIKTQIEEGDLVLFDKNSRQGQELRG
ncbi:phage tail length tape measure family protein [Microbulbifer sp. SSSA007]|uniref:phage tail length tape measure family protein n=1 Tax=Microbulbifer sp. SSSA007 TaxID=3243379 RepID=UPI0040396FD2